MPRVEQIGELLDELKRFGWVLMSPRKEAEINKLICTKTSIDDYENLCILDVFGVTDIASDDIAVHQDFKDQPSRSKYGWYKTGLIGKDNSTSVQNNKLGCLGRLKNLLRSLKRNQELFESYDQVIQE